MNECNICAMLRKSAEEKAGLFFCAHGLSVLSVASRSRATDVSVNRRCFFANHRDLAHAQPSEENFPRSPTRLPAAVKAFRFAFLRFLLMLARASAARALPDFVTRAFRFLLRSHDLYDDRAAYPGRASRAASGTRGTLCLAAFNTPNPTDYAAMHGLWCQWTLGLVQHLRG